MTLKQTLHSMVFLSLGGVVLFATLFMAHKHQLLSVSASPSTVASPQTEARLVQKWFDRRLPGSLPYTLLRGREKMADLRRNDRQDPSVTLARSHDRLLAADYAFSLGQQQEAVATVHKSFGYLHLSWQNCLEFEDCSQETRLALIEVHSQMQVMLDEWMQTEPSDSVKVAVSQLQARIIHFEQRLEQLASMSVQPTAF